MNHAKPHISVDPAVCCGDPCIGGTRLQARMVADYVYGGMDFEKVLSMWELDRRTALVACWYVARYGGNRRMRKEWRAWAFQAGEMLWHPNGPLPDPPPGVVRSER